MAKQKTSQNKKPTKTAGRNNSKTKTSNTKKTNSSKKAKQQEFSFYELNRTKIMLCFFLFSALLLCIAFIPGYNFWATVRGAFFGFFGFGFYFLGFLLLAIGVRIALDSFKYGLGKTTASGFGLVALISSVSHLFTNSIEVGTTEEWVSQLKQAGEYGFNISEDGFSMTGGIIGGFFGGGLLHLIGKAASFIILLILLVFCVIVYLNISFSSVGNGISSVIVHGRDKANDGVSQFKVIHGENKIRRQEEKEIRLERQRLEREEKAREQRLKREERLERERLENERIRNDFDFSSSDINNDFENRNFHNRSARSRRVMNPVKRNPSIFTPYQPYQAASQNPSEKASPDGSVDFDNKTPEQISQPNEAEFFEEEIQRQEEQMGATYFVPETDPDIFGEQFNEVLDEIGEEASAQTVEVEASDELSNEAKDLVEKAVSSAQRLADKNRNEVEKYSDDTVKHEYSYPPIECLAEPDFSKEDDYALEMKTTASKLVDTLKSFGVETTLIGVSRGPSVTRYELQPAPGVKISKITNLADDIALNLASSGVRIEAPIPNKSAVGIEVPNHLRSTVTLREIISASEFQNAKSKINVALGKDITGDISCADIAKMPHLLIAGTTGSGKSVCLNCMIVSILYKAKPSEVKLLMIDPKQVEFSVYNGVPHLLVPVISDVRKAAGSLAWAVGEMENRYKAFSAYGVRDIGGYNRFAQNHPEVDPMAQIVIFIDELNDLMMVSPKEVEDSICRLAQKARAAGMHLVVATQRPSVDVITGIIKANIPSRISLSVSSQVDSRTILDTIGAEKLLGNGDMLYNPIGVSKPVRVQGAYVSDSEIEEIVDFLKAQQEVEYDNNVMDEIEKNAVADKKQTAAAGDSADDGDKDELLETAMQTALDCEAISVSLLQRKLRIGYARAARIVDELDSMGLVGPSEGGGKPRKFLLTKAQFQEMQARKDGTAQSSPSSADNFDVLSD